MIKTHQKHWVIETKCGTAEIVIPACCREWANIAIYKKSSIPESVMHMHVTVPGLVFEKRPLYPNEMRNDVYQKYIDENRDEILALIKRLNSRKGELSAIIGGLEI